MTGTHTYTPTRGLQPGAGDISQAGYATRSHYVPSIRIWNPSKWGPEEDDARLREIHAGFIFRTESSIRELERYVDVSENAKRHMYRLLDGDMGHPWILLQNPTYTQEDDSYRDMLDRTETFRRLRDWIPPRLSLDTMPIVDVFPLVDNATLRSLPSAEEREIVTSIVFRITMDLIWTYGPSNIISMQCYSRGSDDRSWTDHRGYFHHDLAARLSSSVRASRQSESSMLTIDESQIYEHWRNGVRRANYSSGVLRLNVIMSRHPTGIRRSNSERIGDDNAEETDRIIRLLGEGYSSAHLRSHHGAVNRGTSSMYSCYERILAEMNRRAARASSAERSCNVRSVSLSEEDMRRVCLGEPIKEVQASVFLQQQGVRTSLDQTLDDLESSMNALALSVNSRVGA